MLAIESDFNEFAVDFLLLCKKNMLTLQISVVGLNDSDLLIEAFSFGLPRCEKEKSKQTERKGKS